MNGKPGLNLAVNPARTSGNGIYFEMGGGWQGWNQRNNEVTISDFEIARSPGSLPRRIIDDSARQHALKIPRTMRSPLPTHLLVAPNGDLLRGELVAASENQIRFRSGEETLELARNRVSAVIWLRTSDPKPSESSPTNATNEKENVPEPDDSEGFIPTHLFTLMDGSRLRLRADRIDNDRFIGTSSLLGECSIAIENVREMHQGLPAGATLADKADTSLYADWIMELTPEPKIPGGPSESSEEGIGESAPPVELTMLDGSGFTLEQHRGKVVVLDFWASWCGPCIRAIPEIRRVVAAFPPEAVTLCAINQGETTPIITRFLQNREWTDLPVALDFTTEVGKAYGVEGIPHTVVIDPVGKVASIHRGFSETFRDDLFEAIAKALQQ
ncbi:MAG: TlpA disulfide reductase family protein [Verrucomicrobiota bacterium]